MANPEESQAKSDTPPSSPEPEGSAPEVSVASVDRAKGGPPADTAGGEAPQPALPEVEAPSIAASEPPRELPATDEIAPGADADTSPRQHRVPVLRIAAATGADTGAPRQEDRSRRHRFLLVAASFALVAAGGAMAGAFGGSHLSRILSMSDAITTAQTEGTQPLRAIIAQLRSEVAALKSGLDASGRAAGLQTAKVNERFDRLERAQADQTAKLAKAVEALERDRRDPPREVTGSINPRPAPPAAIAAKPQPASVSGWVLRDVYHGIAVVQGRYGLVEVEQGDVLPGLGRVEAIRKQDGRWVVVTSKGLITAAR